MAAEESASGPTDAIRGLRSSSLAPSWRLARIMDATNGQCMDAELFRRMQEAAERFNSGESDFEEIMTPNGPAQIVRDPADPRGFRLDFVGGGARHSVPMQEYPASPSRPPGYPAPLPFLENSAATVNTTDQSVTWPDPPQPEESLERLKQQSVDDGWKELGRQEEGRVLEKDGVQRTLLLMKEGGLPQLVMRERPSPPAGG